MTIRGAALALTKVLLFSWFALVTWQGISLIEPSNDELRDLGSFLASGDAANRGANPYESYDLTFHVRVENWEFYSPNLNPPIALYVFRLAALADPVYVRNVWLVTNVLMLGLFVVLSFKWFATTLQPLRVVWAFALAGLWHTLRLGQIYAPLLIAVSAALRWVQHRPLLAGVCVGAVCAVKPNFLIWPVLLAGGGNRRVACTSIATFGIAWTVPLLLEGPSIYGQWIEASRGYEGISFPNNASLPAQTGKLWSAGIGMTMALLLGLAALHWAHQCRPNPVRLSEVAIVLCLLAGPTTWSGYTLALLPLSPTRRVAVWQLVLAAGLLTLPPANTLAWALESPLSDLAFGWAYGWALLLTAVVVFREAGFSAHIRARIRITPFGRVRKHANRMLQFR